MKKEKSESKNISYENFLRPMTLTLKAVVVKEGKILLLKRSPEEVINKNKFDLPGGHLEVSETIKEGLKREISEETGLEVEIGAVIKLSEFPKDSPYFDKIKSLRFIAYYKSGEVKVNQVEHSDYLWLPIGEAIEKFDKNDGFENEKRETLIKAKKYLEMKNAENLWKRALADLENYKKRIVKDKKDFRKYCLENFILDILPVIDNFEMAVEHIPEKDKNSGWVAGILHIRNQLGDVLKKEGVEKIEVKAGDKIDESIHDAISGDSKKGKVKKILKEGYRLGERVIRAASVVGE